MIKRPDKSVVSSDKKELSAIALTVKEALSFFWDIGKTIVMVVAIAFVIRFYLIQPFYVEGQSMEPNFNNGEYLLIDELSYRFRDPQRGEVIVFKPHISTYQNYIKRVIALPKESINIDRGVVIKNDERPEGIQLEELYLSPEVISNTIGEGANDLADNQFFVMGDNRTQSSDSRIFGPIARQNIVGRVWLYIKIAPWKEISLGRIHIKIPKITSFGRVAKPNYYNID